MLEYRWNLRSDASNNGAYINQIRLLWYPGKLKSGEATNQLHHEYHASGVHLSDVDFLIEDADHLLMVEYKNANIGNAAKPNVYDPNQEKNFNKLVKKFYDSLHYLHLLGKVRPVQYLSLIHI